MFIILLNQTSKGFIYSSMDVNEVKVMYKCFQSEITIGKKNLKLNECNANDALKIAVRLNRTCLNTIVGVKAELAKVESKAS